MDHNTEYVIIEIVRRPRGRPKIFTEEEQKEKVKIQSRKYYEQICEKKEDVRLYYIENRDAIRERKRLHYLRKKAEKQNSVN